MNACDAISSAELDHAERLPDYQCEDCGAPVGSPGLCAGCAERFENFIANGQDPRR